MIPSLRPLNEVTRRVAMQKAILAALVCLLQPMVALAGPPTAAKALMTKALEGVPGKEVLMLEVEYPPGGGDEIHRHDAQAFVYVLEGSIQMQVRGGELVTLTPGQTFYEATDDVHVVGRNVSDS